MDVLAMLISLGALAVSIVGVALSDRRAKSNERIALEAREEARNARRDALWADHIESIHGMISLNPIAQDAQVPFTRLRVTATALADGLRDWAAVNEWVAAEHALGSVLMREAMVRSQPGDDVERQVAVLRSAQNWGMTLLHNARHFRAVGRDDSAMSALAAQRRQEAEEVLRRNGWPVPTAPSDD